MGPDDVCSILITSIILIALDVMPFWKTLVTSILSIAEVTSEFE